MVKRGHDLCPILLPLLIRAVDPKKKELGLHNR